MSVTDTERRLVDLGERRIVAEILAPRYTRDRYRFGDDCAVIGPSETAAEIFVATTDPCPEPLTTHLGIHDLYHWGWLLATINLSDLAAAGAKPRALMTSLILPNDTRITDFMRLLDGIDDCAGEHSMPVIGGNLKEGPKIDLTATAFGSTVGSPFSRRGANVGDLVAVVGPFGRYWAGVLSILRDLDVDATLREAVLRPRPVLRVAGILHSLGLVTACIDNSDGFYASIASLARANDVGFNLRVDTASFPDNIIDVAMQVDIDPVRFAMGFGDWNLICCFPSDAHGIIRDTVVNEGVSFTVVGEVVPGDAIQFEYRGRVGRLRSVDSERFRRDSMFTAGIQGYIDTLLEAPLLDH